MNIYVCKLNSCADVTQVQYALNNLLAFELVLIRTNKKFYFNK